MTQCGLYTEVQDALSEAGGQPVLEGGSCHPNGDMEVTSVPLEPAKAGRSLACGPLSRGGELETLWTSQDMKGHG